MPPKPLRCLLKCLILFPVLAVGGSLSPSAEPSSSKKIRGVVISTHGSGQEWGTDAIVPAIRELSQMGANWVSTHPYARISQEGEVRYRGAGGAEPLEEWVRPIREAHQQGLKVFIKPHLAYWGSGFSWRGAITFQKQGSWDRFWKEYRIWILDLASACKNADGFCVGTELDLTLGSEKEWRELIKEVRERTDAALTYAANWPDYQRVPFWDALDVIGIQAYFPVSATPSPDAAVIQKGWKDQMKVLRDYSIRMNRKVVFTELGYSCSFEAPVRPWEGKMDGDAALPVQESCLRIALAEAEREPSVTGVFLWKWFVPPYQIGRNYRLAAPSIKKVIELAWKGTSSEAK